MAPQDQDLQTGGPSDTDIELLSRYLDGELPPSDSRVLEARLSTDAELRSALVRLQELNQRLRDALSERASVPAAVRAMLEPGAEAPPRNEADALQTAAGNVLRFPGRERRRAEDHRARWPMALAASFAMAAAMGLFLSNQEALDNGLPGNDRLVSAALDAQRSGGGWTDLGDGRELQPILTFPHEDGRWCREYLLRGNEADWRAVACRESDKWVTQAAGLESYLDSSDAYRPAGASDSAPVAVFISQHAADIALGHEDEQRLLSHWNR